MSQATLVMYAATACAYRVQVLDGENQPLEEYTGGNSRFDSAGFVPAREGVGLRTMKQYAKITAVEMAQKHGLAPDRVAWDEDEAQALREDYAERRQHLGA
jgi:hypothetical protein